MQYKDSISDSPLRGAIHLRVTARGSMIVPWPGPFLVSLPRHTT